MHEELMRKEGNEHKEDNGVGGLMTGGDQALFSSEWFGAIIRYVFFLGTKNFSHFYSSRSNQFWKNVLVGWLFKLVFLATVIAMLIITYG